MASIRDVAKQAGVGLGTVSRVLNNTGYVSEETRAKVLQTIDDLDYVPNELARNLLNNKTGIVGIIVPDLNHPFFSTFCRLAEIELYNAGFKTMICSTVEVGNREQDYIDMLQNQVLDGIITGCHTLDDEVYNKIKKPIVGRDRNLGPNIPEITSDHEYGGILAARKFVENGCKKVVCIRETVFKSDISANRRYIGFEDVLKQNQVEVIYKDMEFNKFDFQYLYDATLEYLSNMDPDIDGIFTSDVSGVYCLKILQDMGRKVPEEIKIIGYDATYITRMCSPTLTCVRQNLPALASASVKTILQMINGDTDIPKKQIFNVDWQEGGTTL